MPQPFTPIHCATCRAPIDAIEVLARHIETCSMVPYLPRDIVLDWPPLIDTMRRFEREYAAALLVLTCQKTNAWSPVSLADVEIAIKQALAGTDATSKWVRSAATFPIGPDFADLIAKGFARMLIKGHVVELTSQGVAALHCWAKPRPFTSAWS
jgi:hypothetical protein